MSREELESKLIVELKEMAKEAGVARYSMLSKSELVDALVDEDTELAGALEEVEEVNEVVEEVSEEEEYEDEEQITFNISTAVNDYENLTYPAHTALSKVLDDCQIPRSQTVIINGEMQSYNALTRSLRSLGIQNGETIQTATKVANA